MKPAQNRGFSGRMIGPARVSTRTVPAFYRNWMAGASKARGLRRAQLRLLADLRAGTVRVETRAGPIILPENPRFWAGFILIGEPE